MRAPERHRDRDLSERAQRWLDRLPDDMRPDELARRFPRIVNRLAELWRDDGLTEHVLTTLREDSRGGRQGFPPAVAREIEVLYELHGARTERRSKATDSWPVPSRS